MEDRIRYDVHNASNQIKDMQAEVNTLKQQVNTLEKVIRIVDEHIAGA